MATKEGVKTGGRVKGSKNKKDKDNIAKAKQSGLMPIDYMLSVMRDENEETPARMDAAKAAAPYLEPKLAPLTQGDAGTPVEDQAPVTFEIVEIDGRISK